VKVHMKKRNIETINILLVLILVVGVFAVGIFTADQMGAFYREPEITTAAKYAGTDAPVLRIATDYDFCPNSYYNSKGKLSGFYIEVITEAANRIGMTPEFMTDNWPGCREKLTSGAADVLLGLEIFSNMEGTLRTIPIGSDELNVYGKTEVTSAAALSGKKIALMARSVISSTFDLNCEYVEYYTNTEILEAVENGDVDYGICHGAVAEKIIEKNDFHLKKGMALMKSFPALAVQDSNPQLQEQLNAALKDMAEDGTIYRLKTKWIEEFTKDRSFRYVVKNNLAVYSVMLIGIFTLFVITLFFKTAMKNQNQYITALLDYQKQLQDSNEETKRANLAKSEFLSHMSHDIRTPMNGIMGMAGIIRKNIHNPNKISECLDSIDMASDHLMSLINDVLDMSKLESGKVELESIEFSLDEELRYVANIMEPKAREKQIELHIDDSGVMHPSFIGSPGHLRRILINLVSNALKYTPDKGKVLVKITETSKDACKSDLEFKIQDNGIGMSADFASNYLYEPFMQENDNVRTKYQGTGLGMAIVYELVKNMQGTIHVDTKPGEGTTFTVVLPFEPDERQDAVSKEQTHATDIHGMHILLAEDNQLNREIAQYILEEAGAVITTAEDGEQAVRLFSESEIQSYDAILMDIMMPKMDGLEATRQIREMKRRDAAEIPIIAMTANAFVEDRKKTAEAGMNAHLTKPLEVEKLFETLARYYQP